MRWLYTLVIRSYAAGIRLAAPFHAKAKLWCSGRKSLWQNLESQCAGKSKIVWFHCASLGEYEQGKPLIQKFKASQSDCTILLTFFSPSGYETAKNDPTVDIITYLPIDTRKNAIRFIRTVHPKCAVFVKYEYWYNMMQQLHNQNIPYYYISAVFRPSQYFFKPCGRWFAKQLRQVTHFFVQNETSVELLQSIGIKQITQTGDTRFDRVFAIASQDYQLPEIELFKQNKKLFIAGSSWPPDETLLAALFPKIAADYKLIIAPHRTDHEHIKSILQKYALYRPQCYTKASPTDLVNAQVLVIDCIGILSKIYKYSHISYIGGAFKTGLHNTLEAAVFGVPLFFGPAYNKFNEAISLVKLGGAFSIHTAEELHAMLQKFKETPACYQTVCDICKQFIINNLGSAERIFETIEEDI
ncbi:MAG: 3-deoxy-D-manno-octulosonic acid transferase [Bacteroidales bacterium]|nr:3-deoxy-D-manno-octulosonic acid transferase [Bacteroidales bacterium]